LCSRGAEFVARQQFSNAGAAGWVRKFPAMVNWRKWQFTSPGPAALLPRQQAKLARGAKDKEQAMSQTSNTAIAVIGIDIGKNSFHVVGHDARGAIISPFRCAGPTPAAILLDPVNAADVPCAL
jgi:hypothetical protein